MTTCLKLASIIFMSFSHCDEPPPTVDGYLSAYGELPTVATLDYRMKNGQILAGVTYDVLLAVYDCARIGERATLHTTGGSYDALIFDCAGVEDGGQDWMIRHQYVGEMGYWFWQQYPHLLGTWATVEYQ